MGIGKKRKDCFFGMHFDFHAMPGEVVARYVSHESITKMLDEAKPEYVQIDTKGHPGLSSYPTEVGNQACEIKEDMLKFWREETKKRGIPLYAHHSGLFDMKVIEQHPDWAAINEDGVASESFMSVFSPYTEEFLIPQLKELAGKYDLDGVWVDGESWGTLPDYGIYAKKAWKEKTGLDTLPKRGEEGHAEYCKFVRDGYEDHIQKYITAVKAEYPDFQMTSNWVYSHCITTKPRVNVDFISGDYSCSNSVNSARHIGRGMVTSGIPWDLMAWGQNAKVGMWDEVDRTVKEYEQYCQEAAVNIALGGGFEFFNIIYGGGGYIQEWAIPRWKKVAEFCKERKELCWKSKIVPEIAVAYNEVYENNNEKLIEAGKYYSSGVASWILALQNNGYSTSMLKEYQIAEENIDAYKVIVVPEGDGWRDDTIASLKAYAKKGGKLIVEGKSAKYFEDVSGVSTDSTEEAKLMFVDGGESIGSLRTTYYNMSSDTAKQIQDVYEWNYYYEPEKMLGVYESLNENGNIFTIAFDLSGAYKTNQTAGLNGFVKKLIENTGFEPVAKVSGSTYVDVTTAAKEGNLLVNLVNLSGSHDRTGVRTFTEVPPLHDIEVSVKCGEKPKKITLEPEGKKLKFSWDGKRATVKIDKLHIHSVVKVYNWEE